MSTRQPSLLRKAISVLASFALAVAFVPTAWAEGEGSSPIRIELQNNSGVYDDDFKTGYGTIEYQINSGGWFGLDSDGSVEKIITQQNPQETYYQFTGTNASEDTVSLRFSTVSSDGRVFAIGSNYESTLVLDPNSSNENNSFTISGGFCSIRFVNVNDNVGIVPDTVRGAYQKPVASSGVFVYSDGTMTITANSGEIAWSTNNEGNYTGSVQCCTQVNVTLTSSTAQHMELHNRGTQVATTGDRDATILTYTTAALDYMEFEPRFGDDSGGSEGPGNSGESGGSGEFGNPEGPAQPEAQETAIRILNSDGSPEAPDSLYYSLDNSSWNLLNSSGYFSNKEYNFGKSTVYFKYVAPEGPTQSVYLIKESTQIGDPSIKSKFESESSLSLTGKGTIAFCDPGTLKVKMPSGYSAKYRFANTADCTNVADSSWTEVDNSGVVSIPATITAAQGSAAPTHAFVKIITSDDQGRSIDYQATEIRVDGMKDHEADTRSLTGGNGFMFENLSAASEYVIDVADTATRTASFSIDETSHGVLSSKCTEMTVGYGDKNDTQITFIDSGGKKVSRPVALPANTTEQLRIAIAIASDRYYIPYIWINDKKYATYDTGIKDSQNHVIIGATIRGAEAAAKSFSINLSMGAVAQVAFSEDASRDSNVRKVSAGYLLVDQGKTVRENEIGNVSLDVQRLDEGATGVSGAVQSFDLKVKVGDNSSYVPSIAAPLDITMELDTSRYPESDYTVYREHDGTTEDLNATYDRETGALSFRSNLFSTYTIVDASKASSGGTPSTGGGSYIPAPAPQEPPIANTGSGDSASTTVDVTDKVTTTETGSTQVAVDADLGTKIVENAVANKVADVVIKAETTAGSSTETAVALPASTVKELAEKTEASVTISTDSAQITLDKAAVAAVAEQAGDAGSVQLVVQTSEQNKNKVQIEVTLQTSNGNVSDFRGGSVTISVPVTEELAAKKIVCVYIDANGKYTKMPGALSADGKSYVFSTGHFSTYAVMTEEEANAAIAEQEKAEAAALAAAKPAAPSVKLSSPAKGKLTVKASAKKAKGYRVYYKKAGWMAYKTYTTSGTVKALSKTFKKLSKGSYTVKVRAFGKTTAGKIAWGAKSKAKKVAVK